MATTGPGTTALVPGPQIHQLQGQRSHRSPRPAVNRTAAVHYPNLFLRTQASSAVCYHGLVFVDKWVLRRSAASIGALSTLISTSTAPALLVHRYPPAFDLIAVQDQQLTGQQQCK